MHHMPSNQYVISDSHRHTHMNTICFLVGPEQRVWHRHFDDLDGPPLGIWRAGQPVVSIQRDLVLHQKATSCVPAMKMMSGY